MDNGRHLKVSIITVCRNSESNISFAINSVLSQTYSNIEYLVIDGDSKDSTMSIVHSYGDDISYSLSEPDRGIYDAMNKGLELATGDVICFLNSDDFYLHAKVIEQVAEVFNENLNSEMVFGNVDFVCPFDLKRSIRAYSSFNFSPSYMRFGFMPAHPATFIRRRAYKKVGGYKLGYKIGADFEWFVRALVVHRLPYVKLNQTLVRMREGGVSTSGLKSYLLSSKELLIALLSNGVYSNMLFILTRLPIKFFHKIFRKV
jgi:glycosyltransferase involved in cell wall biosynthesis